MAKQFQIHRSDDATKVIIRGDIRNPEPSTAVIEFPGGFVEVSRCTDGSYWAHLSVYREDDGDRTAGDIRESRIDYTHEAYKRHKSIPPIPAAADIEKMAVRIYRKGA